MRVLTHFALEWDGDEPSAVRLTFRDGAVETFTYPEECTPPEDADPSETLPLDEALNDACAAIKVEFGDDDGVSEQWFDAWLIDADGPLGARREKEAPAPVSEIKSDLSGASESVLTVGAELTGDLSGESASEVGEQSEVQRKRVNRKKKKRTGKLREGAGCKQPDQVAGWEAGRLLCVTRNHRATPERQFGRCEYRVRCNEDGSYTLEFFQGNRTDLKVGTRWPTVSDMWWALLAMHDGDPRALMRGKQGTRHHRMTIKKFFKL